MQGSRTKVETKNQTHPVLNGVGTIFAESDVYGVSPLAPATILLRGMLTETLESDSPVVTTGRGEKHMPVAWLREHSHGNGNSSKIFTTTMGAAVDLTDENLRRLVINGIYWGLDLEVPQKADAALQSTFIPTMYGFKDEGDGVRKGFLKKQTPSDLMNVDSSK